MLTGSNLDRSSSSLRKLTNIQYLRQPARISFNVREIIATLKTSARFSIRRKSDLTIPVVDFLPAPNRLAINHLDYAISVNEIAHFRLKGQVVKRLKASR